MGEHFIHLSAVFFLSAMLLAGIGSQSARAADRLPAGTASIRAYADTVITGQVKNDQGEPLMGVSVSVTGSKVGYITDAMGGYSIKSSGKATLVFTYMGYVSQTVQTAGRTKVDVVMQQNTQSSLEDVVVTALGVSKVRRGLGYAVQEVKGKEFTEGRMNNIASALTGKIAGVDAIQTNAGARSCGATRNRLVGLLHAKAMALKRVAVGANRYLRGTVSDRSVGNGATRTVLAVPRKLMAATRNRFGIEHSPMVFWGVRLPFKELV